MSVRQRVASALAIRAFSPVVLLCVVNEQDSGPREGVYEGLVQLG